MNILVVDYNEQNQNLFIKLLKRHSVKTAENGVEALERARINPPDMIIIDSQMSEMDGFLLCKTLKNDKDLKNIPVLFCNAKYTDEKSLDKIVQIEPYTKQVIQKFEEKTLDHKRSEKKYDSAIKSMDDLKLIDILDIDILQGLQDSFARSFEVASLLFDDEGRPITNPSNFSDFCKMLRRTEKGMKRCEISDSNLSCLVADGSSVISTCKNFKEIMCAAVPIVIGNRQIATWGIGQKVIHVLSDDNVYSYAKEVGVDSDQLMIAAKKLSIGSKEQFEQAISFLDTIANNISLLGLQNIHQAYEITERKAVEQEIKRSEEKLRIILDNTTDMVVHVDKYGRILDINKRVEEIMGYKQYEIVGKNFAKLGVIQPKNIPRIIMLFKDAMKTGISVDIIELELKDKSGNKIHVEAGTQLIKKKGKIEGAVSILRDITERKQVEEKLKEYRDHLEKLVEMRTVEVRKVNEQLQKDISERKAAEDQIKAALAEKEVLLQEIHHRVKNNLQVISSMLNLQARATEDKATTNILLESQNRINAMALIHNQLYESKNLSEINMKIFLNNLITQLLQTYSVHGNRITHIISVVDYPFPISTAIPIGLIINELLSNTIKYAFNKRKEGKIELDLRISKDGKVNLIVSDDGVGLPEGFDINGNRTLGLRLVKILVENQLDGTLEIISKEGTIFNIKFDIKVDEDGKRQKARVT